MIEFQQNQTGDAIGGLAVVGLATLVVTEIFKLLADRRHRKWQVDDAERSAMAQRKILDEAKVLEKKMDQNTRITQTAVQEARKVSDAIREMTESSGRTLDEVFDKWQRGYRGEEQGEETSRSHPDSDGQSDTSRRGIRRDSEASGQGRGVFQDSEFDEDSGEQTD